MRLGRCPVCHAHLHLDALVQDEAGRELLALCATLPDDLGRALVGYLGLWRPARGDLDNARALKLAREALALEPDAARLAAALHETVEAIRAKGEARRMTNHNYLKRVLEGVPQGAAAVVAARASAARRVVGRLSATEEAILAIRQVGVEGDAQARAHRGAQARAQGSERSLGRELHGFDDDAIDV